MEHFTYTNTKVLNLFIGPIIQRTPQQSTFDGQSILLIFSLIFQMYLRKKGWASINWPLFWHWFPRRLSNLTHVYNSHDGIYGNEYCEFFHILTKQNFIWSNEKRLDVTLVFGYCVVSFFVLWLFHIEVVYSGKEKHKKVNS